MAFYLDNNLAEVGAIASYSGVGKGWEKKGNRILHKSIPQPYFPLVANSKVRSDQIKEVQKNLVGLTASPQGQEILKRIGIDGFDIGGEAKMKELPKWLGQ